MMQNKDHVIKRIKRIINPRYQKMVEELGTEENKAKIFTIVRRDDRVGSEYICKGYEEMVRVIKETDLKFAKYISSSEKNGKIIIEASI